MDNGSVSNPGVLTNGVATFTWTGTGTISGATLQSPGTYTCNLPCSVTVNSAVPQQGTITLTQVSSTFEGGNVTLSATPGTQLVTTPGGSFTQTKTWVSFVGSVTPDSATNLVRDPHTFTISIGVNDGQAPDPAPAPAGTVVSYQWVVNDAGGQSSVVETCALRADDPGTPANEAGTCVVTKNSPVPASATLTILDLDAVTVNSVSFVNAPVAAATPGSLDATKTWVAQADLGIDKQVQGQDGNPAPVAVLPGQVITYSLTVTNAGPSDAQGVAVVDPLPAVFTQVALGAVTPPWLDCALSPPGAQFLLTCSAATMPAGSTATVTLTAVVPVNLPDGTVIANTATVTAQTPQVPDTLPNTDTASVRVGAVADLSVTKTDSPDPVSAGANLTYTITVANGGPNAAQSVSLTDTLPAGMTFVSLSAPAGFSCTTPAVGATGPVTCSIASLAAAATPTFTLIVHVDAGVASGTVISNTAIVTAATNDPNAANNAPPPRPPRRTAPTPYGRHLRRPQRHQDRHPGRDRLGRQRHLHPERLQRRSIRRGQRQPQRHVPGAAPGRHHRR